MSKSVQTWLERAGFAGAAGALVAMLALVFAGHDDHAASVEVGPPLPSASPAAVDAAHATKGAMPRRQVAAPKAASVQPEAGGAATQLTLHGRVVDVHGAGLAHVAVLCGATTAWDPFRDPATIALYAADIARVATRTGAFHAGSVTQTDGDGHFHVLPPAAASVVGLIAVVPELGYAQATVEVAPGDAVTLTVRAQPRVVGHVRDADGAIVAGATVQLYAPGRAMPIARAKTDASGAFATPRVPAGSYLANAYGARHRGTPPETLQLGEHDADHRVDLTVVALPQVGIDLRDDVGAPWTGERVRGAGIDPDRVRFFLARNQHATRSALDLDAAPVDRLDFDAPTGRVSGTVKDRTCQHLSAWLGERLVGEATLTEVGQPSVTMRWLAVADLCVVRLRVTLAPAPDRPLPIRALLVETRDGRASVHAETSGAAGEMTLQAAPGASLRLLVAAPGFDRVELPLADPVRADGVSRPIEVQVELQALAGVIEGTLIDLAGRPVPHGVVAAMGEGAFADVEPWARVDADGAGRFRLAGLPLRPLRVVAAAAGVGTRALACDPGDRPLRLTLQPVRTLTVHGAQSGVVVRSFASNGDILDDDATFGRVRHGSGLTVEISQDAVEVELSTAAGDGLGRFATEARTIRLPAR